MSMYIYIYIYIYIYYDFGKITCKIDFYIKTKC